MKKILITTNFILIIAVAFLLYKHFKSKKTPLLGKTECVYKLADIAYLNKKQPDSAKILMLGDSRIAQADWNKLLNRNDVLVKGINGDKLYCICQRLNDINTPGLKICIIEGGIKDLYTQTVDSIYNSFLQIIDKCEQQNVMPIITAIVKVGSKASDRYKEANQKIDAINSLLLAYAVKNNISIIDLNQNFTNSNGVVIDSFFADGAHFNANAYRLWSKKLDSLLVMYKI